MKVLKKYKFPVLRKLRTRNTLYNMINITYPAVGCMWGFPGGLAIKNSSATQESQEIRV